MPTHCPLCGVDGRQARGRGDAPLPEPRLPSRGLETLIHWVSAAMDIEGVGEQFVRRLWDAGLLRSMPDLYRLTVEQLAALDGYGEISATTCRRRDRGVEGSSRSRACSSGSTSRRSAGCSRGTSRATSGRRRADRGEPGGDRGDGGDRARSRGARRRVVLRGRRTSPSSRELEALGLTMRVGRGGEAGRGPADAAGST